MNEQNMEFFMRAKADDGEVPAWKLVDLICRKWAVMSQFEKDQSNYAKLKEMYE